MAKLFLRTFGCQMNEYDSARIADLLHASEGLEASARPEDADVIVFNTCSVREKAQEKVFADLGRVKHLKRANPNLMIAVGGCVASQEGAAIVKRAPYVDVVFGPQTLHRLPDLLARRRATGEAQVDISFPEIEKFDHLPPARVQGASAFVSIMEGCSKYCSFCVVPYTRGEEVSRPFEDVVAEIASLGVKEVTLLGQNVNAWRGTIDGAPADFSELLYFVSEIPGIERIRYTTSHPREFTQRLIDAHRDLPKLAPHVHLPVQSGSDRVLAAMKRGYTSLEYRSIARKLLAARPDLVARRPTSSSASPARPRPTSRPRSSSPPTSASTARSRSSTARGRARPPRIFPTAFPTEKHERAAAAAGAARFAGARGQRSHGRARSES
jgi:tRNA-2-methylthio-N6-dimethylallyladenosine synthase